MPLPYQNATAGEKALSDLQKILRDFGCKKFGTMTDDEEGTVLVQFEYRGRQVSAKASINGYAQMWLKENPYTSRKQSTKAEWEKKAIGIASVAVYSLLRDWIKGQVVAVETGILSFEGAFLGQIMLPSGKTVLDVVQDKGMLTIEDQSRGAG